ncbi:MAG: hypothetical protein FWH08_05260 [Oscillospiraceae bacterium]|nr:hypothetical protein [Oscillospiraceae bacterium]
MIITSANVNTSSSGSYEKTVTQSAKLVSAQSNTNTVRGIGITMSARTRFDYFEMNEQNSQISDAGDNNNNQNAKPAIEIRAPSQEAATHRIADPRELKLELIMRLFSALRGERFVPVDYSSNPLQGGSTQTGISFNRMGAANLSFVRAGGTPPQMFSLIREEHTYESESVSYSANGRVTTADGKTIDFSVSMNMSRSAETYLLQNMGFVPAVQGNMIDPLIINYGGTAASLTDEKFDFDLDFDGTLDRISFAGAGSGFLALDKNGDGIINDGSELFGPQNGDGFAELRKYDSDGNGWIDEADEVYLQLRVWSKDKDGNDALYTLKELDIGAIYLYPNKTEFGMFDSQNNAQGNMSSTSFFLKDGGGAGTISHFDLLA